MSKVKVNTMIQMWRARMVQEGKLRIIRKSKEIKGNKQLAA
ncbi:MAG: hypothetical protein OIF32_09370 [Campylobacterales bacterium]|nr:hypothetical protein [Campylobacterales bacterium]